jgi:hypothetical protein
VHRWHADAHHLEELAHAKLPEALPITALCWSSDATRVKLNSPDGRDRILDTTSLREAPPPPCEWAEPRTVSADGHWRAELKNGHITVVPNTDS